MRVHTALQQPDRRCFRGTHGAAGPEEVQLGQVLGPDEPRDRNRPAAVQRAEIHGGQRGGLPAGLSGPGNTRQQRREGHEQEEDLHRIPFDRGVYLMKKKNWMTAEEADSECDE